ncbi:Coenzyme Q-binding protein coq10a, mitochondrial [Mortierella polycephala]|uniref:Coenzyme Q-binding protein coq10a, mitochondrial n=1 Tax=Mortierella polycephala TaxID=41804 RepID=A0A9P6PG90_9FUNG|nr:Coenzyme Q-binding protein coq10a, mitochondrial [Mortierella polycephala]
MLTRRTGSSSWRTSAGHQRCSLPWHRKNTCHASTATNTWVHLGRRRFITLPKIPFPNILKPLSASRHYKDRTLLKYSQQEFYDLVANVDDYYQFLPWCTYSKMSLPVDSLTGSRFTRNVTQDAVTSTSTTTPTGGSKVTMRHGELGIGFNTFQERYVSTVTCQAPWMVRAVSYDSKLFKELSTTWKFTPNVPKATTLDATMDQEVEESQVLIKLTVDDQEEDKEETKTTGSEALTVEDTTTVKSLSSASSSTSVPVSQTPAPKSVPYFTAAAVFGADAVPHIKMATIPSMLAASSPSITNQGHKQPQPTSSLSSSSSSSVARPSELTQEQVQQIALTYPQQPLPSPPKQTIQRTASPSNLATMDPSDYPSCWVDFEIQFEFSSPVHASMSSLFFDQVSKEMLNAFVKQAEVLYGKR